MNKTKIILATTGGIGALAVLALGVMTWLAFADRTEAFEGGEDSDGLEGAVARVAKLTAKNPYPCVENKKRLEANAQVVEDWCTAVRREVSKGDWCPPAGCTPAQFKEQLVRDVKALLQPWKDSSAGTEWYPIIKPDFSFGPFKDYLADKMPSAEQLPRLQRQWYDLTSLVRLLTTNGVEQVTDLQIVDRAAADAAKAERDAQGKSGKKGKSKAKKGSSGDEGVKPPSVETYKLSFLAGPEALASVVRTLSFQERFTVVDDLTFVREHDAIVLALGAGEKKDAAASGGATGGRRGRRRTNVAEASAKSEKDEGVKLNPVVFDPAKDSTVKAELVVSVYDFRSLEEEGEGTTK